MDSDDIMYPHRLEQQFLFMEAHPEITVCAAQVCCFGKIYEEASMLTGTIDIPLVYMLQANIVANPTTMIRSAFLHEHRLNYKPYDYAEDYKLWSEIAQRGGKFHVLPKVLLKYRISDEQISNKHRMEQRETALRIKNEILHFLISQNKKINRLEDLYETLTYMCEQRLMLPEQLFGIFSSIFYNEYRLSTRME